MASCRSSGVLTATDKIIHKGQCKLVSIHATYLGTPPATTTIKVFDNTAGSGKELARMVLRPSPDSPMTLEYDMHGVIATNGLFMTMSPDGGSAVAVEYS